MAEQEQKESWVSRNVTLANLVLVLTLTFGGGQYYARVTYMSEQIEDLRRQIMELRQTYARADLLASELRAINNRLTNIEGKLK